MTRLKYKQMNNRFFTIVLSALLIFPGCSGDQGKADAYGTFEVTEVTLSSETAGPILRIDVRDGMDIAEGEEIALIDTTMFHLQKMELEATVESVKARLAPVDAQNEILRQQMENIGVDLDRISNMLKSEAATQKQYDDLAGQIAVLRKQISANNTQKTTIASELAVLKSRMAILTEQISRSSVKSPLNGVVIEKYAEAGEITAPGRALVKIADLSVIRLKVYVSGADLNRVKIGTACTVRIDNGENGYKSFPGRIARIADKAEFTPKIIQTREERVTLVYAVIIEVANDGSLKPGMPGEAIFGD